MVFNALHGKFGEDGRIQGILDMLGIPYTHSGMLSSALAMNKAMARLVFQQLGLRVAKGFVKSRQEILKSKDLMPRPYVIKPIDQGSVSYTHLDVYKRQDVPSRLATCQLLISRAGASTIAELCLVGRPALLIPCLLYTSRCV